jgi:hypothetical protein
MKVALVCRADANWLGNMYPKVVVGREVWLFCVSALSLSLAFDEKRRRKSFTSHKNTYHTTYYSLSLHKA